MGDFAAVLCQSDEIDLDTGTYRILSLDALILAKRAMTRPRDRAAVLQLESIRERLASG